MRHGKTIPASKPFTTAIAKAIADEEKARARARERMLAGKAGEPSGHLAVGSTGESRDIIAQKVGLGSGMTQQQIADELGVSQPTVHADLSAKSVRTQKPDKSPRQRTRYEITQYTKPETAARRIREVFGGESADRSC